MRRDSNFCAKSVR